MSRRGGKRIGAGRPPEPNSVRSRRRAQQQATVLQHPSVPAQTVPRDPEIPELDEADAPDDLTMEERRVWLEFASVAMANGRLTPSTSAAFKTYCRWVVVERNCASSVTDRGSSTHDRAMKWVARFYDEFSLTPGGRAVAKSQTPQADPDDAFFGGVSVSRR